MLTASKSLRKRSPVGRLTKIAVAAAAVVPLAVSLAGAAQAAPAAAHLHTPITVALPASARPASGTVVPHRMPMTAAAPAYYVFCTQNADNCARYDSTGGYFRGATEGGTPMNWICLNSACTTVQIQNYDTGDCMSWSRDSSGTVTIGEGSCTSVSRQKWTLTTCSGVSGLAMYYNNYADDLGVPDYLTVNGTGALQTDLPGCEAIDLWGWYTPQ
jgi:hypothetical protein